MSSILVVEDDDQLRTMLKLLLTGAGHDVTEASDGAGVCDMHQRNPFDLIITDLVMPGIEGLGVITEVRRRDPKVRIIAISGAGERRAAEYLKMAKKLGAQVALSKPFSNEQFLAAVSSILEGS